MKLWSRSLQYTVYRKMFLSYVIIVVVTITLISSVLFSLFSSSTAKEISDTSKAMLDQTSYTANLIYEQVHSISQTLVNNKDVYTVMYAKKRDPLKEYQAVSHLSYIAYVHPFIKYIGVYNGEANRHVTSLGIPPYPEQDADVIAEIRGSISKKYLSFIPRKSLLGTNSSNPEATINVLTFILYPDFTFLLPSKSAIVINIDETYIQNTIRGMSSSKNDNIFVMDSFGTILSHTKPDYFLQDFSVYPYVKKILESENSKGYFIQTVDNKKQLVTYVKSENLNWYFVNVKPYYHLVSNIRLLRNITIAIALTLMAIGVLLSHQLTQNLYDPLSNLLKKINALVDGSKISLGKRNEYEVLSDAFAAAINRTKSLEASLETAYPVFKETYMRFLLRGDFDDISSTSAFAEDMARELSGPYYSTFVIMIDNYKEFKRNFSEGDQSLFRFAICNVAQELIERHFSNHTFTMEEDKVVILAQTKNNAFSKEVFLTLSEIQEVMLKHFKISLSISIGDIVSDRNNLHRSYESAVEYGNYRLFYGHKCIIDYNTINQQLESVDEYPHYTEEQLLQAIEANDRRAVAKELDTFMKLLSHLTYHHALIYSNQMVISIAKYFANILDINEGTDKKYYQIIHDLSQLETLDEIKTVIKSFCVNICTVIQENRSKKNYEKVKEVQNYIKNNYSDPNISLELMAEKVGLSPGYFGKLFKSTTNTTFNDYLNSIRLEKAKDLLISTDEPASTICEEVGIYNNTYFFTLFKKAYKMTPSQYRKNIHHNS